MPRPEKIVPTKPKDKKPEPKKAEEKQELVSDKPPAAKQVEERLYGRAPPKKAPVKGKTKKGEVAPPEPAKQSEKRREEELRKRKEQLQLFTEQRLDQEEEELKERAEVEELQEGEWSTLLEKSITDRAAAEETAYQRKHHSVKFQREAAEKRKEEKRRNAQEREKKEKKLLRKASEGNLAEALISRSAMQMEKLVVRKSVRRQKVNTEDCATGVMKEAMKVIESDVARRNHLCLMLQQQLEEMDELPTETAAVLVSHANPLKSSKVEEEEDDQYIPSKRKGPKKVAKEEDSTFLTGVEESGEEVTKPLSPRAPANNHVYKRLYHVPEGQPGMSDEAVRIVEERAAIRHRKDRERDAMLAEKQRKVETEERERQRVEEILKQRRKNEELLEKLQKMEENRARRNEIEEMRARLITVLVCDHDVMLGKRHLLEAINERKRAIEAEDGARAEAVLQERHCLYSKANETLHTGTLHSSLM